MRAGANSCFASQLFEDQGLPGLADHAPVGHIALMGKARIEIRIHKTWEIYHVQDGTERIIALAGSKAQATRYAKSFERDYGLSEQKGRSKERKFKKKK